MKIDTTAGLIMTNLNVKMNMVMGTKIIKIRKIRKNNDFLTVSFLTKLH